MADGDCSRSGGMPRCLNAVVENTIIAVVGTLAGTVLAFAFQWLTSARQRRHDVADRTRAEQLDAAAALPAALVEYRHAQIARRADRLMTSGRNIALDNEVRAARADAWSALYRLELLVDDRPLIAAAYELMGRIKALKTIDDVTPLDEAGTRVHWAIQDFVKTARTRLGFVQGSKEAHQPSRTPGCA